MNWRRQNNLPDPRIAVIAADAWPAAVWYLRKFSQTGFWQPDQKPWSGRFFFITSTDVSDALAEQLKTFRPEFFGLRPNVLLILWSPATTNSATGATRTQQSHERNPCFQSFGNGHAVSGAHRE
ncbi:MAG: hypothetical protein WDN00_17175 [Limisphaerales bacterium]